MKPWIIYGAVIVVLGGFGTLLYQELGEQSRRKQDRQAFESRLQEMRREAPAPERFHGEAWKQLSEPVQSGLRSLGFTPATLHDSVRAGFSLKEVGGKSRSLSDFRGNWVLLNFWATWCPPCRLEMPSMQRLWSRFRERGLVVLAANLQEQPDRVRTFVRRFELSFPVLLDRSGGVADRYYVTGVPETWLIDPAGRPIARLTGAREWDTEAVFSLFSRLLEDDRDESKPTR